MKLAVQMKMLSTTELLSLVREEGNDDAIAEFEKRGRSGDPEIFDLLGRMFLDGFGELAQDCNKAIGYFSEGIERGGKILCALSLANAYYFGVCVRQNYEEAFKLIRRVAINEEDWIAASRLGLLYEFGHGCERDLTEAAKWMYVSWKRGSLVALGQYGRLLVKNGKFFIGNLIRIGSWSMLPLMLVRGLSDRRCRVW